jgi:LuxR family transcriptional regulator, maltose regulon positive regulatory protein
VVWLHLDTDDSDPATFFYFLTEAARGAAGRLRLPALRPEYHTGLASFARAYFRKLYQGLPRSTVLVLDNYEALQENAQLHALLADALGETPGELGWMVLSRSEPPATFARARTAGQLIRLGWSDLRFSREESQELARMVAGAKISASWVDAAHASNQGWAAGLVLAFEALTSVELEDRSAPEAPPLSGTDAAFDYFAAEVLRALDTGRQQFLLCTACLPQLGAADAAVLSGRPEREAAGILEELARKNYFTFRLAASATGRARSPTYRYHPLFRSFLLQQARARLEPAVLRDLRLTGSRLLANADQFEAAIDLLREEGQWPELCALVRRWAPVLLEQGRHETLHGWLCGLPETLPDETRGWLLYWRGAARLPLVPAEAQRSYADAFHCFVRLGDSDGIFLSWAGVAEALLYGWGSFRDFDVWIDALDDLLARFRPGSLAIAGRVAATMHGALMFRRPAAPAMDHWERKVRRFLRLSRLLHPDHYVLLAINLFHHDLWRGRTARAKALLDSLEGAVRSQRIGPVAVLAWHTMRAVHGHFTGDGAASLRAADAGLEFADRCGVHFWDFLLLAQGAFGAIAIGDLGTSGAYLDRMRRQLNPERHLENLLFHDAAAQTALATGDRNAALEHSRLAVDSAVSLGGPFPEAVIRVGVAHILLACGRNASAWQELGRAETLARGVGSTILIARCLLGRAHHCLAEGRRDEATRSLTEALALCREHGYFGTPWWRPEMMADLCAHALRVGVEPEFVRALIRSRGLTPGAGQDLLPCWSWEVKVFTLGPDFRVLVGERAVAFPRKAQHKPLELLQALIALGGQQVPESRLAEALWPDSEADAAQQAVATTLHRLRRLIGSGSIVRSAGKLSVDRRQCWIDCLACEDIWDRAPGRPELLVEALALYRGPFLASDDQPWALACRERLAGKFVRAVQRQAHALCASGQHRAATVEYERALAAEPTRESLYRSLIALSRELGEDAEAADAYRRCQENLRRHFSCEPSRETTRLALASPSS